MAKHLLHRLGQIADSACRSLLNEQISRVGVLEGELHQIHRFVKVHEEASHVRIGNRERLTLANAINEERDNAAARAHHVAIACAANGSATSTVASIRIDDAFHHSFGLAHSVNGVGRLIGRKAHDLLYTLGNCGMQHVVSADDVSSDRLHRKEFA